MNQDTLPAIRQKITLNAPIEKVWAAVSTAEGLAGWWMPSTIEAVLGKEFTLHAEHFGDSPCKITELDPPNRIGFDWGKDWHLAFELKTVGDNQTEFTLIHSGWDAEKMTEFGQPHETVRCVMDSGWVKIVQERLPAYIGA
ncbi:SRPBCC domain-containing protein [Paenibacillus sp. N1-5-1-14]|uniref:SRPBCC family protein n=1 Tax=Paenibacillus radicibacter TaxID=2972488 RepID=UPI002158C16C|nr:SRPBCC domain-containing protein [Paenibacillus radicibacter]MCR8642875.1 SRPBCC domain-containing protein [Paenibacillus radicibacter]